MSSSSRRSMASRCVRIIAGNIGDHRGPGSTHTPMAMTHVSVAWLAAGPSVGSDLQRAGLRSGRHGYVGSESTLRDGQLVGVRVGRLAAGRAHEPAGFSHRHFEFLVLGGQPIGEPVEHYGPFVMNSRTRSSRRSKTSRPDVSASSRLTLLMPHVPDPDPVRARAHRHLIGDAKPAQTRPLLRPGGAPSGQAISP